MLLLLPALSEGQQGAKCPQSGPLSETQLAELQKGKLPAPRIRQLVVSCGIDFEPSGEVIGRLRATGMPEVVLGVVRVAFRPAERKLQAERAAWEYIKDSLNPAVFEGYLRQYPEGHFAAPARQRYRDLNSK